MELDSIIALGIFGIIFGIISYKMVIKYQTLEHSKVTNADKLNYETKILQLTKDKDSLENSRDSYMYKLKALKRDYDLDFSDLELEEGESGKLIPEIAQALYPKLPKSVKELLGKSEIEEAIFKFIGDNPDKLSTWIEKFIPKKDQGSSKNSTVLQESYI